MKCLIYLNRRVLVRRQISVSDQENIKFVWTKRTWADNVIFAAYVFSLVSLATREHVNFLYRIVKRNEWKQEFFTSEHALKRYIANSILSKRIQFNNYVLHPSPAEGDLLVLMRIPLASASALASALASHFFVCRKSYEPVVGFLPNLHGYIIGTLQRNWLDFGDLGLIVKVTAVEKLNIRWQFLVCIISSELVVGFLPNLHEYIIRT